MIYNNYSKTVAENSDLSEQEITSLNSKILPYIGENISGSKVNALITVVYAMNRNFEGEKITMSWQTGGIDPDGNYNTTKTDKKVKIPKNPLAFYYLIAYNTNCKQKKTFATCERKDNKVTKRTHLNYFGSCLVGEGCLIERENVYTLKGEIYYERESRHHDQPSVWRGRT